MATKFRPDTADQAARAARQAANEARTPEARLFLREHANELARLAAARRLRPHGAAAVSVLAPLVGSLPV
jgi:hypothetical protein